MEGYECKKDIKNFPAATGYGIDNTDGDIITV